MPDAKSSDQLWKMHLHYMEYLEEVDDATFIELVGSWIDGNRPYVRCYWRDAWNSYALSIRVVIWMQQLARRAERLPAGFRSQALSSICEQLRFLERHLETDLGGNHLIKNIKALLWASCFFTGPTARRWQSLALRLLQRELSEQILPDGFHFERSPSYHCQVFADLLECRLFARPVGSLAAELDETLTKMAQAVADTTHPDGRVALFNDAGLSMTYSPDVCLQAFTRVTGRGVAARRQIAFDHAGYFGFRTDRLYVLVDCGPVAPDHLPAHGHGDILSFELSVDGQRIVVDPGVFEYNAGPLRDHARSSRSHNTVTLGGAEPCDFFGSFRCGRRAHAQVLRYESTADGFVLEGTHDGFDHLVGRPRHLRRVEVGAARIRLHDRIIGGSGHEGIASFLLHPECRVELRDRAALIRRGTSRILLESEAPPQIEQRTYFPDMGVSYPTVAIICRLAGRDSHRTELRYRSL